MIKVLVLDFDDVVRISEKEKNNEICAKIGFEYEELMKTLWENEAGRKLLCGKSSRNQWWKRIQKFDTRLKDVEQSFVWNDLFGKSWIDKELVEYVRSISTEIPTSIFTNCDKKEKKIILKQLEDNHPFTHIITSAEIGFIKPDPTAFLRMLTIIDVAPKECLFIDDSTRNVIEARGMEIEGVLYSGLDKLREMINKVLQSDH